MQFLFSLEIKFNSCSVGTQEKLCVLFFLISLGSKNMNFFGAKMHVGRYLFIISNVLIC